MMRTSDRCWTAIVALSWRLTSVTTSGISSARLTWGCVTGEARDVCVYWRPGVVHSRTPAVTSVTCQ